MGAWLVEHDGTSAAATVGRPAGSPVEPNSLGVGSLVLGDRWNLLILREAFLGATRFRDWTERLAVSDPVLSTRLRDLSALELFDRGADGAPARGYRLTDKAKALWPIFVAIWLWNQRWATARGDHLRLHHLDCGFAVSPLLGCGGCRARGVTPFETSVHRHPGYSYDESNPPRPYRRSPVDATAATLPDALELLGDRWSTSVLAAAFLGARRFTDFTRDIGSIPPLILTQRLATFVDAEVLRHQAPAAGGRRLEYHLTAKGSDFFGIFSHQIHWSSQVFADRDGPPLVIRHLPCGEPFEPIYVCNACDGRLERRRITFAAAVRPDAE